MVAYKMKLKDMLMYCSFILWPTLPVNYPAVKSTFLYEISDLLRYVQWGRG